MANDFVKVKLDRNKASYSLDFLGGRSLKCSCNLQNHFSLYFFKFLNWLKKWCTFEILQL